MSGLKTENVRIPYGSHKGELFTRLPVSYLKWMMNVRARMWTHAEAELKRRGTVTPQLDISGHAIDRASLRVRKIWHEDRDPEEGLYSWLVRVSSEALQHVDSRLKDETITVEYKGMKLAFDWEGRWPVLKTVMRSKRVENEPEVEDA